MLMMGFTKDGQVNEQMGADQDARFGVSSADNRENRADIEYPAIDPDADAWQKGNVVQVRLEKRKGSSALQN